MTIRRVLVANRGEIAVRIVRTCKRLGVETVAVVSDIDRGSGVTRLADRTVCIGPSPASESYLKVETIVQAALSTGCDAIHPGYGFLSERQALASMCEAEGVIFIGPTAAQIAAVGDKLRAREEAIAAGVPVAPGGEVDNEDQARVLAEQIGAPLLIKAVGGGGGRGMKRVDDLANVGEAVRMASAEAGAAFGDARVYIERFVARGRHVEVQVLGDGAGEVLHLGERDCSVQRRYQKLIEETPAPNLPEDLRRDMQAAAVRYAARLNYRGAGTVEFLVDVDRNSFYFLEMNARIQVEHPVTEMVTGIDIVAEQIAIAEGRGLQHRQSDIAPNGWAVECRINAEDPERDFAPSPGRLTATEWPTGPGVRVDTHIAAGDLVPPYYDSMIAKVIAHGADRREALARLHEALGRTRIDGVRTNIAFQRQVLADARFAEGGVDTGFLPKFLEDRAAMPVDAEA